MARPGRANSRRSRRFHIRANIAAQGHPGRLTASICWESDSSKILALIRMTTWSPARTRQCDEESRRNERLRAVDNDAGMVTPDGMPLVWFARLLGNSRTLDLCVD